jgi:hypothetical protein
VLLIITYRPEFEPPWVGRPDVTTLTLNRLGQREIADLIDRVTGNKPLPASIRQDIIERTDGIPLFVEEMTKAVLEAGSESASEHTAAAVPSPGLAVPASLHASLMARLDRLGSAKEVAQIGAVIGREFPHALIAAVARKGEPELRSALDRLIEAGLLFRQGVAPHATYLFKHALVRDVAYGSLLRDQRQQLHSRIADMLAEHFPTMVEAQPEVLAHHYREAGMADAASTYFERAADRAAARSAYIEAAAHFRAAIQEADHLSQKDERTRRALTLLLKLGPAIAVTIGEWRPEVEAVYRRAYDLGREVGDGPQLFRATWGALAVRKPYGQQAIPEVDRRTDFPGATARRRGPSSRGATLSVGRRVLRRWQRATNSRDHRGGHTAYTNSGIGTCQDAGHGGLISPRVLTKVENAAPRHSGS